MLLKVKYAWIVFSCFSYVICNSRTLEVSPKTSLLIHSVPLEKWIRITGGKPGKPVLRDILDVHRLSWLSVAKWVTFTMIPKITKFDAFHRSVSQHLTMPPALNLSFSLLLSCLSPEFSRKSMGVVWPTLMYRLWCPSCKWKETWDKSTGNALFSDKS